MVLLTRSGLLFPSPAFRFVAFSPICPPQGHRVMSWAARWVVPIGSSILKVNTMTALRQQMENDMVLRGMAVRTRQSYIEAVRGLAKFYRRSPDAISVRRASCRERV